MNGLEELRAAQELAGIGTVQGQSTQVFPESTPTTSVYPVEPTPVKPYTLRELCAKDVFPMVSIISKIGINEFTKAFESDEIKKIVKMFTDDQDKGNQDDALTLMGIGVALEIANTILSHLNSCEQEIYKFLSGLSGISKENIAELPMNTFIEMIVDVFKKDEFKGFIGVVSRFVK